MLWNRTASSTVSPLASVFWTLGFGDFAAPGGAMP